jgi:hypothetical protein
MTPRNSVMNVTVAKQRKSDGLASLLQYKEPLLSSANQIREKEVWRNEWTWSSYKTEPRVSRY